MLSFVPTPIGNLEDITIRGLKRLSSSEIVFCEDTRVAKRLFHLLTEKYPQFLQPKNREFLSLHQHNSKKILSQLDISIFEKEVIYISDAGSPGISDPGIELVNFAISNGIDFEVLPGATALTVGALLSGFSDRKLLFWGFLPHKGKERERELQTILDSGFTTILYESPHRIEKLLDEVAKYGADRDIFIGRELTKQFEERIWGKGDEIGKLLKGRKGEFVVVIRGEEKKSSPISLEDIEPLSIPPKEKAKLIAKITGEKVKEVYSRLVSN